ncbi:phage portal protein [Aestuariivirga sp.]|uniref:phage portal protein n=1 Tax=Aestuariivirga sp. TaxID=2650926 RepID=UPI00391A74EB
MLSFIRDFLFLRPRFRSYDGGTSGRRWRGAGEMANQNAAALAARGSLARRARYLVANNALAAAGVEAWLSALTGTGIKAQSAHLDPNVRALINVTFEQWTDKADGDGLTDFYGLQALIARRMVVDGEALAIMSVDQTGLKVRLLDPEQLDGSMTRELGGGARIIQGVEFDVAGRRIAYHIFRDRPGLGMALTPIRVPAEDVLHIFRVEVPGQVRGVSWFAPILLRLREYDEAIDAQLVRQKLAAMLAGFIVDPEGTAAGFASGEQPSLAGLVESGLAPGTLSVLNSGQDIRFSDPPQIASEAIDFLRITAREIASGLGVPYEALTGDLSSVNYSSIRAGLVEFRRRAEAIQHGVLAFQLLRPVFRRWIITESLAGRLGAPGSDLEPLMAVRWITPKQQWVDPLKDAQAEATAIAAGLMSRREAIASRGYDIEQVDAEIAADNARAKTLGLDFTAKPASQKEPSE